MSTAANQFPNNLNLPHLPVPKLDDTLEKYLNTVKPFLNNDELKCTLKLLDNFKTGIGKELQQLLERKASNSENWLADWWLNVAYLQYRDPVCVYSSPGLVFPFECFKTEEDRLLYTAKLILAAVSYKLDIDKYLIYRDLLKKSM